MARRCVAAVGALFAVVAALLVACASAIVTRGFYKVTTYSAGGYSASTVLGPLKYCTAVVGASRTAGADDFECAWNGGHGGPSSASFCDRSAGSSAGRHFGALALILVGALLVLAAGAAGLLSASSLPARRIRLAYSALAASVLGVAGVGAGALFAYSNVFWRYCGAATLCDAVRDAASSGTFLGCDEGVQLPLYVVAGGVGSALFTIACEAVQLAMLLAERRAGDDGAEHERSSETSLEEGVVDNDSEQLPRRPGSAPTLVRNESYADGEGDGGECGAPKGGGDAAAAAAAAPVPGASPRHPTPHPGGDWVWDAAAKLWWSDSSAMYLEHESGHFYHPRSGKWFDPVGNRWLKQHELTRAS